MNTLIEQTIQEFDEKFDTAIEQNDHIGQWIPELKAFLRKAMEKAQERILTGLKAIEANKWKDADHCSCLRYSIDQIENNFEEGWLEPSDITNSQPTNENTNT